MVPEQTVSNAQMVVLAKDGLGRPLAGLPITWTITGSFNAGTLSNPEPVTDSNGLARTSFVATSLFGVSFQAATVSATSSVGSANFVVTTVYFEQGIPGYIVQFLSPSQSSAALTAPSGTTLPGAVVVQVQASRGFQSSQPIPNVSLRVIDGNDSSASTAGACNGPSGVALTDSTGTATCDLVVTGTPGTYYARPYVGEAQQGFPFQLQITPGASCSFSLSATSSQQFAVSGGTGTVNVSTRSGCSWTATSNATWISISSGASGTGNGTVAYSVGANPGAARTGTITVAGQAYTVTQNGTAGGGVVVTTTGLSNATVNVLYSAQLSASGGQPPYTWSTSGALPPGLALSGSTISGIPTTAGTFNFSVTARDANGASSQSASFSVTVNQAVSSSSFAITTTMLPLGAVGTSYQQTISTVNANRCGAISSQLTLKVTGGALPDGLAIPSGTSSITGTPTLPGTFNFTLTATSICGDVASAKLSITITGTAPQMTAAPTSLAFIVQQGATNIPADQQIALTSSGAPLSYTATASTNSGSNWLTIKNSSGTGTTPGSVTVGIANYSTLAPGAYNGSISIASQAANTPVNVPVTLTVVAATPVTASPSIITLDQFASPGSNVTRQSISVSSGTSATHFTVAAAVANGGQWLSVNPTDSTTPTTLTASIDSGGLAPGTYTGSIVITPASGSTQTISVALVVSQQPPSIASVQNAASFVLGPVAPGEIVTIFGTAMGPATGVNLQLNASGSVATTVSNSGVLFDGVAAPIVYTSATQISAVVPYEVAGKTTTKVQVSYQGLLSNPLNIQVAAAAPGIFTANGSGSGQGAILNQDVTVNSPSNGADPGSVISIYATGEGQTNPPGIDGAINPNSLPLPAPVLPVKVQIAGQAAEVQYYGAAPGALAGLLQVNAKVPANIQRGTSVSVVITVGSASSQTVTLAIKP